MQNLVGISLGRYQVLEQLGEGGMAVVYKAFDTKLERWVAIKIIRREAFAPSVLDEVRKRFDIEAKALARLSHPNIVKVHDYGEYDGAPYLVMEYVEGGMLKSRLGVLFQWTEAVRFLLPIANALAYAHANNIVHRDIKPGNILLTASDLPMLTDFGIAKILEAGEGVTLTGTGVGIGTPEYMAPEQGMGQPIDARVDIYALGVVLYELVTGRRPFHADTPMAVMLKHLSEPLPSPRIFVPSLPSEIEEIIVKALAKDPQDRYQNMEEMIAAFEQVLTLAPVLNQSRPTLSTQSKSPKIPPQNLPELKPQTRRQKSPWLWIGLGAVGMLALIFFGVRFARGANLRIQHATQTAQAMVVPSNTHEVIVLLPSATIEPLPVTVTSTSFSSPTPEPTPGIGSTQISPLDGMVMVYVPGGEFLMGAADWDDQALDDERPQHLLYLDAYWIDKTEVTNAMYARCVQAEACNPPVNTGSSTRASYFNDLAFEHYPVVYVSWIDASAYCAWAGRRLPSEAEWEKAARGADGRLYAWGNQSVSGGLLNFCDKNCPKDWRLVDIDDGFADTAPVGNYPAGASPYGALDMAGNVWEWVADWYAADYYAQSSMENPLGPASGDKRVLRGGSWDDDLAHVRVTVRYSLDPNEGFGYFGFRCALSP